MNLYGLVLTEKQRCIWMEIYEKPDTPHPLSISHRTSPDNRPMAFFFPLPHAVNRRSENESLLQLPPFRA